jgi:hypothetical protein
MSAPPGVPFSAAVQRSTPLAKDVRRARPQDHKDTDVEKEVVRPLDKLLEFYENEQRSRVDAIREKAYYLWLNGHSQDADENWRAAEAMVE